jgi:trehalose 6-phosphate synthase
MEATRRKLIVAANRAPLSYRRDDEGNRVARRGGGGLVTALRSLVSHHDVTWVASAMTDEDRAVAEEAGWAATDEKAGDGSSYRVRFVPAEPAAYDWYYNVVSNPTLWFLQHYLWNLAYEPQFDHSLYNAWDEGYVVVNRAFAEAIADELEREPEATVFLHDYHLYLAPRFVRELCPDVMLAHFIHIPWPQRDLWGVLPDRIRRELHEGLLGNDIVSFHTRRWAQNFRRSCVDILGAEPDREEGSLLYDGRRVLVRSHPISVDPAEFDERAQSDQVLALEQEIAERRPERLILRVDRTDLSKNIIRGFSAFEAYLEAHPEMHRRVGMLALLDPSRQDIPDYAEYVGAIQRAARAVNDRFQQEGWIPIDLQIQDDFLRSLAAYKQFDVLLVNAIFDGLNLVAKEAPLVNERDGVLILSENAGAHEELGEWALTVNPFDVAGQAEAIHEALEMPEAERKRRIEAIRAHVREHDLAAWIEAQLADLDRWAGAVRTAPA